MKLAIQLYSIRDELEKDFFGTLKKIKDMIRHLLIGRTVFFGS